MKGMELGFCRPIRYQGFDGPLLLGPEEVQVWYLLLTDYSDATTNYWAQLSIDEKARAELFAFEQDRTRFVIGRASLRRLVSRYIGVAPTGVQFRYGNYGKPELFQSSLCFNISHSGNLIIFAFVWRRRVGVDVERLGRLERFEEIVRHEFAAAEYLELMSLPEPLRRRAFFNCWTRKEAYIKAKGEGLSIPLRQFQVSMVPGLPARLLQHQDGTEELLRWNWAELAIEAGYVGALVVEK